MYTDPPSQPQPTRGDAQLPSLRKVLKRRSSITVDAPILAGDQRIIKASLTETPKAGENAENQKENRLGRRKIVGCSAWSHRAQACVAQEPTRPMRTRPRSCGLVGRVLRRKKQSQTQGTANNEIDVELDDTQVPTISNTLTRADLLLDKCRDPQRFLCQSYVMPQWLQGFESVSIEEHT